MSLSERVQKVVIPSVLALLSLGGLSRAQESNPKDWGAAANGLQLRIYLDKAASERSKAPKFRVEMRNVGQEDILLNLGVVTRNGEQYPTAVSLTLADSQNLFQLIELKRSVPASDGGNETLYLPLSVGAAFSFPIDLENYWAVNSKMFDSKLKPGTYWLAAHLNGFIREQSHVVRLADLPAEIIVRASDLRTSQTAFGAPPRSNIVKFEIPSR